MRIAVQQWKESGLTQKVYCQNIGVKRSTFANWVKRSNEKSVSGFIAIAPVLEPVPESVELIYPNGVRLKARLSDIQALATLIRIY